MWRELGGGWWGSKAAGEELRKASCSFLSVPEPRPVPARAYSGRKRTRDLLVFSVGIALRWTILTFTTLVSDFARGNGLAGD